MLKCIDQNRLIHLITVDIKNYFTKDRDSGNGENMGTQENSNERGRIGEYISRAGDDWKSHVGKRDLTYLT